MTTLRSNSRNRARLSVQALEARDVPAATVLDLGTTNAQATANGAILQQSGTVATADFHTFLRLNNAGTEEGYNTDARPFQLDQRGNLTVTHSLKLTDVPTVTIGGTQYREFLLDVNEGVRRPQITLDELRIYLAEAGNLTGYNSRTKTLAGRTSVFDLDGAGNVTVKLNAALNNGSMGVGDAVVLIPSALFGKSTYVYLYSKLGGRVDANGGAESWGVRTIPPPPTGLSISGFVYFDANNNGVREPDGTISNPVPEVGLNGVVMHLTGLNDLNQTVDLFATTAFNATFGDGYYEFMGLRPGTYQIVKTADPQDFFDGMNTPGQPGNGQVQESNSQPGVDDMIFNINLISGQNLTEYNFGELFAGPPT